MVDYAHYDTFVGSLTNVTNFKTNSNYSPILEHVSKDQGIQYYTLLQTEFLMNVETIDLFCEMNDSLGNPVKYCIGECKHPVSPTSLRYLYHACIILNHFKNKQTIDIVEIGGGYGGLCLAIHYLSVLKNIPIHSYSIIDLPNITRLQQMYLKNFKLTLDVETYESTTFGRELLGNDYCLISNYCFSEIQKEYQEKYITTLFPKVSSGFLVWNHIPLYNFGKNVRVEIERPLTGSGNLFVFF